jgi:hypothetical protein
MTPTLRTSVVTALVVLCSAGTVSAQGRNVRDPGRVPRDRGPVSGPRAPGAPIQYNILVTPTFAWDDNTNGLSAQVKYKSKQLAPGFLTVVSGLIGSSSPSGGSRQTHVQLDGEFDHDLGDDKMTLDLAGEWMHVSGATSYQFMPELDLNFSDALSVGPIAYFGSTKVTGGTSVSSSTYGVVGSWAYSDWKLAPEYDFDAGDAVEDSFSAKLLWHWVDQKKYDPWLFASMAKHNAFSIGAVLKLH